MANPTDANGYIGVPNAADTNGPLYPKWLYNPSLSPVIVPDWNAEQALLSLGVGWTETPTNYTNSPYVNTYILNANSPSYANDTLAASGGVIIGAYYLNGNFVMLRRT